MLASPLYPAPPFSAQLASDDHSQARPAKDIDAFNSLLPPPIEFIEGSSTGALAVAEDKYEAINASPKATKHREPAKTPPASSATTQKTPQPTTPTSAKRQLYNGVLDLSWPPGYAVGSGLHNTGNTCFLNSALQCLLHTPPLLRILVAHSESDPCERSAVFYSFAQLIPLVAMDSHRKSRPFTPYHVSSKLHLIAKHMRKGRQEDSHEFLRYAIDALQRSCLAGYPQYVIISIPQQQLTQHDRKIDHKLAETTWVHKIFGGRLRSRVTCRECNHHSDTFDSILDISLDIYGSSTLKEAFKKFVAVDYLRGADKYKCEKCKKPVVAEKRFTIHDAPAVLTVHLKRFSPLGRKIGHFVHYDERLSLQPVMSDGQYGPWYSLYGIISHAGGGPNSGHYFAHVKDGKGRWFEMNDDMVSPQHRPPVDMKSAYILFYIRDKGQTLDAAVNNTNTAGDTMQSIRLSIVANMKKRKVIEEDEDIGVKVDQPFIGPRLPSPMIHGNVRSPVAVPDPQALILKKKISVATKASTALSSLALYGEDDSTDNPTEPKPVDSDMPTESPTATQPPTSSLPSENASNSSTSSTAADTPPPTGITPSSIYATPIDKHSSSSASTFPPTHTSHDRQPNDKKRKSLENDTDDDGDRHGPPSRPKHMLPPFSTPTFKREHGNHHGRSHTTHHKTYSRKSSFGGGAVNPYTRAVGNNTLYRKQQKRRMIM
ncbi:hypothetical protein ID866_2502 [Astraeus odoratus]|nr:hypothetical protein ID866_2502 [Astraeus odoratus]